MAAGMHITESCIGVMPPWFVVMALIKLFKCPCFAPGTVRGIHSSVNQITLFFTITH